MSLDGKIAIITGAAGGIGAATMKVFAARGAVIIATDANADALEAEVGALQSDKITPVAGDITDEATNAKLVDLALQKHGRLDVAFLNAGIVGDVVPTHEYEIDAFNKVIQVNLIGVFLGLKHAVRAMLGGGGGSIICTSSVQGLQAFGYTCPYTASKHAVMGMVRTAALEYARHNIRVNAINPGIIDTKMLDNFREGLAEVVPSGRLGRPEEIGQLVAFLASDESTYITGMPHVISGGAGAQWATPMQVPAN